MAIAFRIDPIRTIREQKRRLRCHFREGSALPRRGMLFQGGLTMRYFRFCILAVISCSMAVAASAQQQWIEVKSPHFSVLTDADELQGREIATYFEQMRSVFGHLLLKDAAPRSATVRI